MPKVAGLIGSSAHWYEKFIDPQDRPEHSPGEQWIQKNYARREFYLGHDGEKDVGTISVQTLDDHAYLGYIYLDIRSMGKGYGRSLMKFAEDKARREGLKGLVLIAHPEAEWAVKAYVKYGFSRIAQSRQDVLRWKNGALKPYYEEGFHLYCLNFSAGKQ